MMILLDWLHDRKVVGCILVIVPLLAATLSACQAQGPASETPTSTVGLSQGEQATLPAPMPATATLSATSLFPSAAPPTPLPTETPVPSATPSPTNTPTPTATPTIPAATVEVEGAELPPGFSMIRFADLLQPTGLTFDGDGNLFATSGDGAIHVFRDTNGDGRADEEILFAEGFRALQGVAIQPETGAVYASSLGRIDVLRDTDGDLRADEQENLVQGLPYDWHWNNNPKFGPDGYLYIGLGSTCDVCVETDPRSATMMRFDPESGDGEIWATGLRNSFDLAFHPDSGVLFATDNGRDDLGEDAPHEELNLILQGADYGFPDCYDDNSQPGCEAVQEAIAFFQPHSSANNVDFYTGEQFPPAYASSAGVAVLYVSVFGAWDYETPVGISRVILRPDGERYTAEVDWFAQWLGNPLGLIVGPDGAIYAGDYTRSAIFRISYGN